MRIGLALTSVILATAMGMAGCRKAESPAVNAAAPEAIETPAPPPPPGPPLAKVTPDGCSLVAAYVKTELKDSGFGLPLQVYVPAAPKERVTEGELRSDFKLDAAAARDLAGAMTATMHAGSHLDCDWRRLGAPQPAWYQPGGRPDYIRFRTAFSADGALALLDTFTTAGEVVALGTHCLYRRDGASWVRLACAPTVIS